MRTKAIISKVRHRRQLRFRIRPIPHCLIIEARLILKNLCWDGILTFGNDFFFTFRALFYVPKDLRTVFVLLLSPPFPPSLPPLIWRPGKEVLERIIRRLCSLMEAYPRPLYSHVLEGVTKNCAAFREDPLTEAKAWSRHVSYVSIPAPSTPTYWRESPRTGPPSGRTP